MYPTHSTNVCPVSTYICFDQKRQPKQICYSDVEKAKIKSVWSCALDTALSRRDREADGLGAQTPSLAMAQVITPNLDMPLPSYAHIAMTMRHC